MKNNRSIIAIALTLLLAFGLSISLTSCFTTENKDLAKINELAKSLEGDFKVSISVKSQSGNVSSKEYIITEKNGKTEVYAKIEALNKFDVSLDGITPPDSYSTVTEGYLSDEQIASGDFKIPSFSFTSSNVTAIAVEGNTLTGNVSSLTALMGKPFDATDIKLTVKYSDEAISEITVNFITSQNNTVTLTYKF